MAEVRPRDAREVEAGLPASQRFTARAVLWSSRGDREAERRKRVLHGDHNQARR